MRLSRRVGLFLMAVVAVFALCVPLISTYAQDNTVTITLAVPSFSDTIFTDKLIADFESSHSGIKVNRVKVDANVGAAASGLDAHFDKVQKFVSAGDVLYVNSTALSEESTRAGYFLNLKPLVDADKSLNTDDFVQPIWQSYQWDQGIWALPVSADPYVLTYDPAAFDTAKLTYPDDKWTVDDLANAIRNLTQEDSSGKVTQAGIDVFPSELPFLFRSLLGTSIIDSSASPNVPKFATAEVEAMLNTWLKLDQDGLIGQDFNKAPLNIVPAIVLAVQNPDQKRVGVLLPGGKSAMDVQAFAVSGGTQHPEQAYALAAWLTARAEVAVTGFSSMPARKSLVGAKGSDGQVVTINITPEVRALIDNAAANAIPLSEMRFVDYLAAAYQKMKTQNIPAKDALQAGESDAVKAQQTASDRQDKVKAALVVATPIPSQNLPAGKIALKFAVLGGDIPNKDAWDKLIADFTASDPQVASVALDKYLDQLDSLTQGLTKYDCVYAPYNGVSASRLPKMINLDPYLSADKTFDKADMIGTSLAQVTLDNKIWALPSDLAPNVLKYDSDRFAKAGVPAPGLNWTLSDFLDALKTLKADGTDKPAFAPTNTFGAYLLNLVAAYGGIPIDYRTTPPTINFSDPDTIAAVQQIADLAKSGNFTYHTLFGSTLDFSLASPGSAIHQEMLSAFSLQLPGAAKNPNDKLTLYPNGTKFASVTYSVGGFYISATAQNPDACYRFISAASKNTGLFGSMPARYSLLDDPALASSQGADTVAVYKQIATLLKDPNTLSITSQLQGGDLTNLLIQLEFFQATDKIIANNKDAKASLNDAQMSAKAFKDCSTSIPSLDASSVDSGKAYLKAFRDCAVKANSALGVFSAGLKID